MQRKEVGYFFHKVYYTGKRLKNGEERGYFDIGIL